MAPPPHRARNPADEWDVMAWEATSLDLLETALIAPSRRGAMARCR